MISKEQEIEVLLDRMKFKLYAAKQHLYKLKEIDNKYNTILHNRIEAEIEIDCFFAQLIGAHDALLIYINDKLNLGLSIGDVKLETVNSKLKEIDKQHILKELNNVSQPNKWLGLLKELRNHSIHRAMLNKQSAISIIVDANTNTTYSKKPMVSFLANPLDKNKKPMDKSVIEYLEESLDRMPNLICRIRKKIPL